MFNLQEFLVNRENRYAFSIDRLFSSEYVYGENQINREVLDKLKQLHLRLSPGPHTKYHIQAPYARPNQTYGWTSPMYIVEDESRC